MQFAIPTVLSHANHHNTYSPLTPPQDSRQPRWRRRSGVKDRAYLCHAHRVLLQGTAAKTEPFYLHAEALFPNRLLIAVISSCFDLGTCSGEGRGACLRSACRGSSAKLLRGLCRLDLSEVRSFFKAAVISGR